MYIVEVVEVPRVYLTVVRLLPIINVNQAKLLQILNLKIRIQITVTLINITIF